jgi:hypothetical protein
MRNLRGRQSGLIASNDCQIISIDDLVAGADPKDLEDLLCLQPLNPLQISHRVVDQPPSESGSVGGLKRDNVTRTKVT